MKLKSFRLKLTHLKWFMFGLPDFPPRFEPQSLRINSIALMYWVGCKPDAIASTFNVTRERVKQILWKEYRRTDSSYPKTTIPAIYYRLRGFE